MASAWRAGTIVRNDRHPAAAVAEPACRVASSGGTLGTEPSTRILARLVGTGHYTGRAVATPGGWRMAEWTLHADQRAAPAED